MLDSGLPLRMTAAPRVADWTPLLALQAGAARKD